MDRSGGATDVADTRGFFGQNQQDEQDDAGCAGKACTFSLKILCILLILSNKYPRAAGQKNAPRLQNLISPPPVFSPPW
ncbi:MAG: hypothetical protein IT259_20275 [Saprospiraceae bacterium]|nr:hypothetical protein [Saprospiraceae bacterium]